jgi:hypothetical protein
MCSGRENCRRVRLERETGLRTRDPLLGNQTGAAGGRRPGLQAFPGRPRRRGGARSRSALLSRLLSSVAGTADLARKRPSFDPVRWYARRDSNPRPSVPKVAPMRPSPFAGVRTRDDPTAHLPRASALVRTRARGLLSALLSTGSRVVRPNRPIGELDDYHRECLDLRHCDLFSSRSILLAFQPQQADRGHRERRPCRLRLDRSLGVQKRRHRSSVPDQHATVDDQRRSIDEAGRWKREAKGRVSDLLRFAVPF